MVYIPPRPKTDAEFLEVMAQIIFVAGFKFRVVMAMWPKTRKAFHNFKIDKVANETVENMLKKEGVIKNKIKIAAIIENAKICKELIEKYGSIEKWVKKIQKENKKEPLFSPTVREEMKKFIRIGHTTSRWLAYVTTRDKNLLED